MSHSTTHNLGQRGYLDVSAELGGEALLLHIFDGSFTPEQVDGHTRRQEPLMLLPLQRLKEEKADRGNKQHQHFTLGGSMTCMCGEYKSRDKTI